MQHIYDCVVPKEQHRWPFRVACLQLLFGLLTLTAASTCVHQTPYCRFYTGCWVGPLNLLTGLIGIAAAHSGTITSGYVGRVASATAVNKNLFVAYLVLSVLSCVASIILCALSIKNWLEIALGNESGSKNVVPCAIVEYVPKYIQLVYERMGKYDFHGCLMAIKLGVAMNSIMILLSVFQGSSNIVHFLSFLRPDLGKQKTL